MNAVRMSKHDCKGCALAAAIAYHAVTGIKYRVRPLRKRWAVYTPGKVVR